MYQENIKLIKCIILGDQYVGKTSFCCNLTNKLIPIDYQTTIGVDFFIKMIEVNGINIKLQLWDTAGHERYRAITKSFYRDINMVIFMFNLNDSATYENLKYWINEFDHTNNDNCIKIIIGNKNDLKISVNEELIKNDCNDKEIMYYSCSSKNDNIEKLIYDILIKNYIPKYDFKIDINLDEKKDIKCCNIL